MGDRAAAERACKEPNPIIDGRKANVNLAILGAKPRGNLTPGKLKDCNCRHWLLNHFLWKVFIWSLSFLQEVSTYYSIFFRILSEIYLCIHRAVFG